MFLRVMKSILAFVLCFQLSFVFVPKVTAASDAVENNDNQYWPSRIFHLPLVQQ